MNNFHFVFDISLQNQHIHQSWRRFLQYSGLYLFFFSKIFAFPPLEVTLIIQNFHMYSK